jgi:IS5 family transposase
MSERRNQPPSLMDALVVDLGGPVAMAKLQRLDAATPWDRLLEPILSLPEYQPAPKGGRPAWPAQTMLRCLLLAKWFNISDRDLEDALRDRLSFRRFVGLALTDATPDQTTFVRFRTRLREARLEQQLMAILNAHFQEQGLMVNDGVMIDATLVKAPRGRKRDDGTKTTDPDAAATSRNGVAHFGYKAHLCVDRSKLITACRLTDANTGDRAVIDELIASERRAVYADSGYESIRRRRELAARLVMPWIIYQKRRGQRRTPWPRAMFNHIVSRVRARVEHVMADLKHRHGWWRVRYRGLARNGFDLTMTVIGINLRRASTLRTA